MELIIIVAIVVFGLWSMAKLKHYQQIRQDVEEEVLAELERRIPVGLNVEEINGVVYGWDYKTNDFVCQGRDLKEFRQHFQSRFPNRRGAIMGGPDELIDKLKQELKLIEQNENLSSQ